METIGAARHLAEGKGFVDLSSWRAIAVSGADAIPWLNDLVSVPVDDVAPGRGRRALLLSPLGGVLASFTVAVPGSIVLLQDPDEPRSIGDLLAPYVLSSDVQLQDRTSDFAIFSFPGRSEAPGAAGSVSSAPSALGTGVDQIALAADHERLEASLARSYMKATAADVHDWRVAAAITKIGVDTADGDLPQECGLSEAVSFDKGCFMGQEAVAKTRNLGRPRRSLMPLEADEALTAGEVVRADADDGEAGIITSAGRFDGRHLALARIRRGNEDRELSTAGGIALRLRPAV